MCERERKDRGTTGREKESGVAIALPFCLSSLQLLLSPHCPSSAYHTSDIGMGRSLGELLERFG